MQPKISPVSLLLVLGIFVDKHTKLPFKHVVVVITVLRPKHALQCSTALVLEVCNAVVATGPSQLFAGRLNPLKRLTSLGKVLYSFPRIHPAAPDGAFVPGKSSVPEA